MRKSFFIGCIVLTALFTACGSSSSAPPSSQVAAPESATSQMSSAPNTGNNMPSSISSVASSTASSITEADARTIALAHASLAEADVTRLRSERSRENGVPVFDVEFTHNRIEFEYAVEIATGDIISFDRDISGRAPDTGTRITESEAIAVVLAEVPGASETDIQRIRLDDDDDGWDTFEGTLSYGGFSYSFDVSAIDGMILSWERRAV